MKKILFLLFLLISIKASADKFYLAPTTATPAGSDVTGTGLIGAPYWSLEKVWADTIAAGDTIYMRGGVYAYTETQVITGKNGASGSLIKVWAYPGESPKITKGAGFVHDATWRAAIAFSGNYVHFRDIEIYGIVQMDASFYFGLHVINSSGCIFENLNIHNNSIGAYIREYLGGTTTNNLILNCDFHHNYDPLSTAGGGAYKNGDGLALASIANKLSTNTVRGCRFWYNSDDGIDLYVNEGYVWLDSCWAWANGYREDHSTIGGDGNGFKLGTVNVVNDVIRRKITNCMAAYHWDMGFTQNSFDVNNACEVYNNTAYSNGKVVGSGPAFQFSWNTSPDVANIFKNNFGYDNYNDFDISKESIDISTNNSWDLGSTITDGDFVSVDSAGISGARVNGAKPDIDFLKLVEGSDLVDAGVSVGISYIGSAPDLGFFEYGSDVDPPNWTEKGIGWDRQRAKINFRDSVNFTRGFMMAGVPISASGSGLEILGGLEASVDDLNNTSGSTGNLQGQINAIKASTVDDSKADTSLSNLSSVAINTHLLPATSGSANLGSALLPFGSVYANGTVSLPSTTSIGSVSSTEIGYVNNVTSAIQTQFNATKTRIDSIVTVLADTANIETLLQIDFDTDTLADLSEVRLKLNIADSLTKYVTPSQLSDSIDAAVGVIISDVRDEIADSLNVLRPTVRLLADTIPIFVFGAGGANDGDTVVFTTSTIYGSFFNIGSDTLVITQLKCIMLGEAGDTLGVDINWSDTLQAVVPTELNTTPHPFGYTSSGKVGSTDTSFNNTKIPPNKWIWCDTPFISAGHKPKYFNAQISGYKIPKY